MPEAGPAVQQQDVMLPRNSHDGKRMGCLTPKYPPIKTMNRTLLTLFIPLLLLLAPPPAAAQQTTPEGEVRAAISAFARAFQEADTSVLQTLLTEDYLHVNGRSGNVLNRDQWLTWVASRRAELDRGEFVYHTYRVEDLRVQLYGEAAVVTGVTHASGRRSGALFTIAGLFTNLWVKQGAVWRRAGFHDSPLPEPEPGR